MSLSRFRICEVEQDGLTGKTIHKSLVAALEKAGVKNLSDELCQKTPGKPSLVISVQTVKQADRRGTYQYVVNINVTKSRAEGNALGTQKDEIIWSASEIGEGNVEDIRKEIINITDEFLKATPAEWILVF